ncbi:MAG: hypothetical protein GEU78_09730 [Actinobacteria bacterium]|nr:hypothetical protein [Actinomycetota bacterium]
MAAIQAVMLGIETRLATIEGLRASAISPDQINPPAAIVGVPAITDYQQAYGRGKYLLEPSITVLVSAALDRTGQMALAEYAALTGAKSIPAAIQGDRTLNGAAEDAEIQSFRPLGLEDVGLIGYYGGQFILRCMVKEAI